METRDQATEPEKGKDKDTDIPVAPHGLLYLTRAYNRKEITFEEWLRLTKEWAERIIRQHGKEK